MTAKVAAGRRRGHYEALAASDRGPGQHEWPAEPQRSSKNRHCCKLCSDVQFVVIQPLHFCEVFANHNFDRETEYFLKKPTNEYSFPTTLLPNENLFRLSQTNWKHFTVGEGNGISHRKNWEQPPNLPFPVARRGLPI